MANDAGVVAEDCCLMLLAEYDTDGGLLFQRATCGCDFLSSLRGLRLERIPWVHLLSNDARPAMLVL